MRNDLAPITKKNIDEGDLNGTELYEVTMSDGTVYYADPHLSEKQLGFDKKDGLVRPALVSIFIYCDEPGKDNPNLPGISQIYVNPRYIVRVVPIEVGGGVGS